MPRYILIDNNSGYIWGDGADLGYPQTPLATARALDVSLGETDRDYVELSRDPRTTVSGYRVYRADIDGSEAVPVISDGQDRETIAAVEDNCEFICFIECSQRNADQALVLCQSADGWSLHAPGSTDEDIACGDAPYLLAGDGCPTAADYAEAEALLAEAREE